jgi:anti-sigma regulatory factor (Ser/Thr protein kinase)
LHKRGDALRGERTDDPEDDRRPAADAAVGRTGVRWTGRFPPDPAAVGHCRIAFEEALARAGVDPALVGDALAVLGEIAANAVRHARSAFTVSVAVDGPVLRLEVFDGDPRPPAMRGLDLESTGGRGLHIVSGIATDWGWQPAEVDGLTGKLVWAELGAG